MQSTEVPVLIIDMVAGEDFALQLFWTSDYNEPIPLTEPVLCDVKDANGQIAMRFSTNADADVSPRLEISTAAGFCQFTAPAVVTRKLVPGRYEFDMFGSVADSASPFPAQLQQIVGGYVDVSRRITMIETAPEADLSENPSGGS